MKKRKIGNANNSGFLVCAALFALGAVAGVCAAALLPPDTPLGEYVTGMRGGAGAFGARFVSSLLTMGKFHLASLLLAFSILGVIGVPLVTGIRGFLLGFAVTSLARYCGAAAIPAILGLFAPEVLIAVPCLLLLSAAAFEASAKLAVRTGSPFGGAFVKRAAALAAAVAAAAAIDAAISPLLINVISAHFPT